MTLRADFMAFDANFYGDIENDNKYEGNSCILI